MSGYGSRVDSKGNVISANGSAPIMVGERVLGNVITGFGLAEDMDGNTVENRAYISFKQSNGATFKYYLFDSTEEWAKDALNTTLAHIATKIVSEEEYYRLIGSPGNFVEFINSYRNNIIPKAAGKTFNLKIVLQQNRSTGKWFPSFPKFPNFIESGDSTHSTFHTNPKYDIYVEPSSSESVGSEVVGAGSSDDIF